MKNEDERYRRELELDWLEEQVLAAVIQLMERRKALARHGVGPQYRIHSRWADPIGCEFLGRFLCYFYGASYGGYRAEEFRDFCLRHLVRNEYVQEVTNFFRKLGEPQTEKPETKPLEEKVQYCAICGDTI